MMFQMSLLFTNILDELTARQAAFLKAIIFEEENFSSKEVLKKYDLGTSANIKNLKKRHHRYFATEKNRIARLRV